MVKKLRLTLIVAVLSLVAMGLFPSNLSAQLYSPEYAFLASGSSAQFNLTAIAALDPAATPKNNTTCTGGVASYHWTHSSSLGSSGMQIHDPRSGGPKDEAGTVWIGWDSNFIALMDYDGSGGGATPPNTAGTICAYVSLDSVVGMREYFAYGQFVLNSAAGTADGAAIPGLPAGVALPAEVVYYFTTLGPQVQNVAPTDIRPEDGKFATLRAMLTPTGTKGPLNYPGLGYGSCVGASIQDTFPSSTKVMQVADFIIDSRDVDCLTGSTSPRGYNVIPVGAAPVVVLANNTNTGAGHTGYTGYSQINSSVLAYIYTGRNLAARDIGNNASDPVVPLTVFQREPLSGTYNTFDFNITCAKAQYFSYGGTTGYRCQETGIDPTTCVTAGVNCGNPMWQSITLSGGAGTYVRRRAIGTSNMVAAVCGAISPYSTGWPDSIGYAFWSYSTFKGDQANCRYLPVDNIDPLYAYPAANPGGVGYLPTCSVWTSPLTCPILPFTKILDGSYPIWSMYRWVYANGTYPIVNGILYYVQKAALTYYTDMVPAQNPDTGANIMNVLHSHYVTTVTDGYGAQYGSNGVNTTVCSPSAEPEVGGDMGGQILTTASEIDYVCTQFQSGTCTNGMWPGLAYPGACQQTNLQK